MCRIESIETVLEKLAAPSLAAAVKPDVNQCQYGEALGGKLDGMSEDFHRNKHALECFTVDIEHSCQLENPCAAEVTEQVVPMMAKTATNEEFLTKLKDWIRIYEKSGYTLSPQNRYGN